jgi:hypothetical protein
VSGARAKKVAEKIAFGKSFMATRKGDAAGIT